LDGFLANNLIMNKFYKLLCPIKNLSKESRQAGALLIEASSYAFIGNVLQITIHNHPKILQDEFQTIHLLRRGYCYNRKL
jgi:hypothetical protein